MKPAGSTPPSNSSRSGSDRLSTRAPSGSASDTENDAIRFLLTLGRESATQDPERATECFQRAAELAEQMQRSVDHARALRGLARIQLRSGRFSEAEALLSEAGDLLGGVISTEEELQQRNSFAMLRIGQGRMDEAMELLRGNLASTASMELDREGDRQRAETLELLGTVYRERGELAEALRRFEAGLELRRSIRDANGIATDLDHLGKLHVQLGQYREAERQLREALAQRRAQRDRSAAAITANHLASVLMVLGELDEARSLFDECRASFEDSGQTRLLARVLSNLGLLETMLGRVEEAESNLLESLRRLRALADEPGQANALNNLAQLSLVRGHPEDAIRYSEESLAIRKQGGMEAGLAKPLFNKGRALLELGRVDEARSVAEEALHAATRVGSHEQRAEALALLAAAILTAQPEEAAKRIAEAGEAAASTGDPRLMAAIDLRAGRLALERGRLQAAQESLSRARRLSRGSNDAFEGGQLLFEEGRLHARTRSTQAAAERLRRAEEVFVRLGNGPWRLRALSELSKALVHESPEEAHTRMETARELARELGLPQPDTVAGTDERERAAILSLEAAAEIWFGMEPSAVTAVDALQRLVAEVAGPRPTEVRLARGERADFAESMFDPYVRERDRRDRLHVLISDRVENGQAIEFPLSQPGDLLMIGREGRSLREDESAVLRLGSRLFGAWLQRACAKALDGSSGDLPPFQGEDEKPSDPLPERYESMIGRSAAMREVFRLLRRASASDVTVLLLGESGTGKELAARAVHARSRRVDHSFVAISCPSIPRELVESELFGYEKGAFTGANASRPGKIELADGGSLFLDEIGDIAPAVQVKLLRFLQEREFERVGGRKTLRVDVRVIAATSRDLEEEVRVGSFRKDLFYRLNVFQVRMPSLRERAEDLPFLVAHFLESENRSKNSPRELSAETSRLLSLHDWPGNVRELQNVLEYMKATTDGALLEPRHLPVAMRDRVEDSDGAAVTLHDGQTLAARLQELEAEIISAALEECDWNQSAAARRLGVTEGTVRNRIRRYGLRPRAVEPPPARRKK